MILEPDFNFTISVNSITDLFLVPSNLNVTYLHDSLPIENVAERNIVLSP